MGKTQDLTLLRRSEFDVVVACGPGAQPDLFNRHFGLNEALVALFGRKVVLVMPGGMVNRRPRSTVARKPSSASTTGTTAWRLCALAFEDALRSLPT